MTTSEGSPKLGHNALIQNMIPELHVVAIPLALA